ncbi:MAG TPA: protein kinase [Verrucomicrobiae bacterium]|nr:protein kinase [Verrucomicrobiae bacterium]
MPPASPPDARCPECGAPISGSAPRRLCSRCLVANALGTEDTSPHDEVALRPIEELNHSFADFEIRRLVGRGGMGAVYEAWQESLGRSVALKVLPPVLLRSHDFLERFQREAKIMARLEHPNIARVYDSGITADGEAFIVMELVNGEPITTFAAAHELDLRQRLDLFAQVCAGVQHAHQKGVIHRDLKPSNILVAEINGQAVPKVIDFGLAKPSEQREGDEAAWLSAGSLAGTPVYMSPEQAEGREIDSRADIYSLGVLLHELLTGQTPDVAVSGTAKGLPDDLAAIVRKAVDPLPDQRYPNVVALPEELQRFLRHEPVVAVPAKPAYLLAKYCRRHQLGLAVATAFLLLLLAGVGLVVRQSIRARQAEELAAARLIKGEQLIEFMLGDLEGRLEALGRLDVLESALQQVEKFYSQDDSSAGAPENILRRAHVRLSLGRIRGAQKKPAETEKDIREAIRLFEMAVARRPHLPEWQEELGQAWNTLAVFHHGMGDFARAEVAYARALEFASRLVQMNAGNPGWIDFQAMVLHNLGSLREATGSLDEATRNYHAALVAWQSLLNRSTNDVVLLDHVSQLYQNLAFLDGRRNDMARAKADNAEALRLRQRIMELDPTNARSLDLLADIQQNISEVHGNAGELTESEEWLNRYRPIREQLAERDPSNVGWQTKLVDAWENQALLGARQGNFAFAALWYEKARAFEAQIADHTPAAAQNRRIESWRLADQIYTGWARQELAKREIEPAQKHWRMVIENRARILNADSAIVPARINLGLACLELAATRPRGNNASLAANYAELAKVLFYESLDAGGKVSLDERLWSSLIAPTGYLTLVAPFGPSGHAVTKSDLGKIDGASVLAALNDGAIHWPPELAESIRKVVLPYVAK